MTGLFLVLFGILTIICFIIYKNSYNKDGIIFLTWVFGVVFIIFVVSIPISRIDSKTDVEYIKIFEQTIEYNRNLEQDLNVLERNSIIEKINRCNAKIANWKVKGNKWYNNKWYYHSSTKNVDYIK